MASLKALFKPFKTFKSFHLPRPTSTAPVPVVPTFNRVASFKSLQT